jgi:membrane-associated phospholipid phosphatase
VSGERDLPTVLWDYELNRAIDSVLPDPVSNGFALATHLGDTGVVLALVAVVYWFGRTDNWQRRGLLVAIAVAALTLNAGLKGVLDVQRPLYAARAAGEPLAFAPDAYDGFSTPSGHAMGSAAIYAGLAALTDIGRRWQRALAATVVVAAVAFSRVVIGVHYLGDVVLGVVLGVGLVWLGGRLSAGNRDPVAALFVLALAGSVLAVPLGSETYAPASISTAAGGLAVWLAIRDRRPAPSGGAVLLCLLALAGPVLAGVAAGGLLGVDVVATLETQSPLTSTLRGGLAAASVGVALVLPVVAERFDGDPRARWLQRTLPLGAPGGVDGTEDPSD